MSTKIIGGLFGFGIFLQGVASTGNIFTRPNNNGVKKFTTKGISEFLIAPFDYKSEKFKIVWGLSKGLPLKERIKMIQLNWILMTTIGIIIPIIISKI